MNTQTEHHTLHEWISYSQKSANNVELPAYASSSRRPFSSEPIHSQTGHAHPHLQPPSHRTYSNVSDFSQSEPSHHHSSYSMHPDAHRYLETSHNHDRLSYEHTSPLDDPRAGLHPHSSNRYRVNSMDRYPPSETTYPADHDTLPSLNDKSHHHSQQEHSSRSPHYHTPPSSILQNISHDNRGHGSFPERVTGYASQPEITSYASSRRVSRASDTSERSHRDSHLGGTQHSDDPTHKLPSFPTMEQTSSIPMSSNHNNPSRHFQHGNDQHDDYEPPYHDLRHGEHVYSQPHIHYSQSYHHTGHYHQRRHLSAVASNPDTPTQSHSHTSFSPISRRNTPDLVLPSLPPTLPYPHPPRSRTPPDPYSISEDTYIEPSNSSKFTSYHDFGTGSNLKTGVSSQGKMHYERLSTPPRSFDVVGQEGDYILLKTRSGVTEPEQAVATIAGRLDAETASAAAEILPMIARAIKKKKKSKMHECEICHKKFPRPSGLKTHMNTHSNERPFACDFPGCTRTFGVRSNARRHMRTHGIVPTTAPSAVPEESSYVVGFDNPMIFSPQDSNRDVHTSSNLYRVGTTSKRSDIRGQSSSLRQQDLPEGQITPSTRAHGFRVRWMPLSVDTQSALREGHNVAGMHAVQNSIQGQDTAKKEEENWHEEDMRGHLAEEEVPTSLRPRLRLDTHSHCDDTNDDDMYSDYSDQALLPQPSLLPGQNAPNSQHSPSSFAASRSPTQGVSVSASSMLISSIIDRDTPATQFCPSNRPYVSNLHSPQSSSSLGPSRSVIESCRCSPPCPGDSSGAVNCRLLGHIYPASISPSVSTHSFAASSPDTSTSPINHPSRHGPAGGQESVDVYNPHEGVDRRSANSSGSRYNSYEHLVSHDSRPHRAPQHRRKA